MWKIANGKVIKKTIPQNVEIEYAVKNRGKSRWGTAFVLRSKAAENL